MNETGNKVQHDFAFMRQSTDSTSLMYVEFIASLQKRFDDLEGRYHEIVRENERQQSIIETERRHNAQLMQEIKDLSAALELEKARNQQSTRHPSTIPMEQPEEGFPPLPRSTGRRQKPQPINPDTIKKLKNDRRHYAVACDAALAFWQRLIDSGLVDQNLRLTARCGVTVAARIVCCFQTVVDPNIRWSFFEKHWETKHLQSNLHRSTYRDEKKYALVNRVFGRPDDAPFVPKSHTEDQ